MVEDIGENSEEREGVGEPNHSPNLLPEEGLKVEGPVSAVDAEKAENVDDREEDGLDEGGRPNPLFDYLGFVPAGRGGMQIERDVG